MINIDRNYIAMALGWLVIGTTFGFWMGASNALQYVGVHVAMLLPGFASLSIYGFIYRLWPELKGHKTSTVQFWLAALAIPLMVLGGGMQVWSGSIVLIALSSAMAIAASALLAVMFWIHAKRA